jgi:RES domain-containing protein
LPTHPRFLDFESADAIRERKAGDGWLASGESAALRVPSAVVPAEWNYLINPLHIDFAQITVELPVPMRFDERLFEST